MKQVLAWIKARLVIVILCVLMVAMIPAAYVVSNMLNKDLRERQTKLFNEEKQKITRASKVDYRLPKISSSESDSMLSESREPNDAVTKWYAQQRTERVEQARRVAEAATELNRWEHGPIIPGFPPARGSDERSVGRRASIDLARALTGIGRGGATGRSAYDDLFDRFGAGRPLTREVLGRTLGDFETRELDRLAGSATGGTVTPAQREELNKQLVDLRLSELRRNAEDFSFYASPAVLFDAGPGSGQRMRGTDEKRTWSVIPTVVPDRPTTSEAYVWQWDFWAITDVLRAISRANRDMTGDPTPVRDSVVKRVESLRIEAFPMPASVSLGDDPGGMMSGGMDTGTASTAATQRVTMTGRAGTSEYDLRHVSLVVIVSSERLPGLLGSINRTNLMTVTDVDLQEVDVWADLRDGYFYGDEHVVRATIEIESVWLRNWTKQFMPDSVRSALGVPEDVVGRQTDDGSSGDGSEFGG